MKITFLLRAVLWMFPLLLSAAVWAQVGYSSAAYSAGKMRAGEKMLPHPEEVIVEEYFNYHQHQIPLPTAEASVAMQIRGSYEQGLLLQIGLATQKLKDLEQAPPVNISLVIDRSGSMSGDRIIKARQAAKALVERLRSKDRLSIVIFDNEIEVLLASQPVSDKAMILGLIDHIEARGYTDLNAALIQGYQQVAQHYKPGQANKILLLTDAITNTGEINTEAIIGNANGYNKDYRIELSLVAIGQNYNHQLSRQLTGSLKSSIHFINDQDDIQKVFVQEIESLLSPVARDVKIEISYDPALKLEQFYGYLPKIENNSIRLDLNNMNNGLSQVLLMRFALPQQEQAAGLALRAELSYFDIQKGQRVMLTEKSVFQIENGKALLPQDAEVSKNHLIAQLAQAIKDMALLMQQGKKREAEASLVIAIAEAKKRYGAQADPDVERVLIILEQHLALFYNQVNKR